MVSIVPVHKLSADFQFSIVKEVAEVVEHNGGRVVGSITDNHKINQRYCSFFSRKSSFEALHPLDSSRPWFLLYDTVHLFKSIRNNWYTEKCKSLSLDGKSVGNFSDIQALYETEKGSILKSTPLTSSSVYPSRLQLQSVQLVVNVFNDKVVSALRLEGKNETADFVEQVSAWWSVVNVAGKGEDIKFNDPNRAVQTAESKSLQVALELFQNCKSGQGNGRINSLTHDTKKP